MTGEAVAIISVSASAVVGVGGLAAAALGSAKERRWQTQEERATELRDVFEAAAGQLTNLQVVIDEAHDETRQSGLNPSRAQMIRTIEQRLVFEGKRIGLRRGSKADDYGAFVTAFQALGSIVVILEEASDAGLDKEQQAAYRKAWEAGIAAEQAFLDATAKVLGATF